MNSRARAAATLLASLVLFGAAAVGGYYWLSEQFYGPGPGREVARIQVEQGWSIRTVMAELAHSGVVRNPRAVEWYVRLSSRITGRRLRIQAGMYEIPARASPAEILELLDQGRVVLEQLTVIEGSTFADFRRTLENHAAVTHTLRAKSDAEVMSALGHPGEHPEGRFFPDTYRFAAKTADIEILSLAYNAMEKMVDSTWQQRRADLPFQKPYEAVILASIVEKETGLPAERARIAGVFVSRLRKGMRLQTDPSVIYGLGSNYDGDIHARDLLTDTPYNTYTRAGLPPTPICLPGRESILAAVQPQETGDLYFVATGTGEGGHHFSKTLEEHNAAVKSYLDHLRAQQRGAPAREITGSGSRPASTTGTHGDAVPTTQEPGRAQRAGQRSQ